MPPRRSYRSSGGYRSGRSSGQIRALQHIEEAQELQRKYGGIFDDVKKTFFELPPECMNALLRDYGREHGEKALGYAEQTMPRWKSGQVKMAGQTMTRLLDLVPRHLPAQAKYELVKKVRIETLRRLSKTRVEISMRADDDSDGLLGRILDVIARQCAIEFPEEFYELQGWINQNDAKLMQEMAVAAEQEALYARAADMFLNVALLRRLRYALPKAKLIEATFEVPTATVVVKIERAKNQAKEPMEDGRQDDDILAKLERAANESELRSGKTTLSEYVVRNMDTMFTKEEQARLKMLAAEQGLELDRLKTEILIRHQTSAHDIDQFKKIIQDMQAQKIKGNATGEYQTPSGKVKIEASSSRFGCMTMATISTVLLGVLTLFGVCI